MWPSSESARTVFFLFSLFFFFLFFFLLTQYFGLGLSDNSIN